jgi:hypothetical protein
MRKAKEVVIGDRPDRRNEVRISMLLFFCIYCNVLACECLSGKDDPRPQYSTHEQQSPITTHPALNKMPATHPTPPLHRSASTASRRRTRSTASLSRRWTPPSSAARGSYVMLRVCARDGVGGMPSTRIARNTGSRSTRIVCDTASWCTHTC